MSHSSEPNKLETNGHMLIEAPAPTALSSARTGIPLTTRLAHEIPKPKDWQALQRGCVLLFRDELKDPNTVEYGRGGQDQAGIDVIGRRGADPDHYVGVQCRRVTKPLKKEKILSDCRAALEIEAGLNEIIFATTVEDDRSATDAAISVESILRGEGYDLTVSLYGWGALQTLIAVHETAYSFFFPASLATSARRETASQDTQSEELASQIALQVGEQLRQMGLILPARETAPPDLSDEDPPLHARIDTFRDLLRDQQPLLAEKGLLALLEKEALDNKPWAKYRIETNLGAVALDLGRELEATGRFEAAYAVRPDDPNANANLALARTIQGRFKEATDLAQKALGAEPRADYAVGYLLQAAARSDFDADPISLIPPDLVGSGHADLGLAEFYNRRHFPDWAERNIELARKHADVPEFKRIGAVATLSVLLQSSAAVPGGRSPISVDDLNAAANDMKSVAEHYLDVGFADRHDLVANLNNAGVLLRLAGRPAECEALLNRASPLVQDEPQLRRLLALAQLSQSRSGDALATLQGENDPESRLLAADLTGIKDPANALSDVLAIDPTTLNPTLASSRWRLCGELALLLGDESTLLEAVEALRKLDPNEVAAELLLIRWERRAGVGDELVQERLRKIAATIPAGADLLTRYQVADQLQQNDLAEEAAILLEEYVDLNRPGPLTTLYLQCLAAARRDEAFRKAILEAGSAVRNSPDVLWASATHAWNVGDLASARSSIDLVLKLDPNDADARLLKIEILLRQNQSTEILSELENFPETLPFRRLKDRFRVASLLGHFGYMDRAATLAYRLFLENRDRSQAWMTLSALVIEEGRGDEANGSWNAERVAPNIAVDLRYDDGEELFLVVEPDAELRRLDNGSWEPDHPLVRALLGLAIGARYVDPSGRRGQVLNLRHKYVARLHYVMEHHEARFPEIQGFRKISIDVDQPGGLDALIEELKQRHDWVTQEQETYSNGSWPLGVLAYRIGFDTIEVAGGLASQGLSLKVAVGNLPERDTATKAIHENAKQGCVLDLLSFWTVWRLQALDAVAAVCGPIHLPQSVADRLQVRRERIKFSINGGLKTAKYEDGRLAATEVAPEVVKEWLDDIDRAIAWVESNAIVCPLLANDQLPNALREFLRGGRSDIFDSLVVAIQTQRLLISDDLPTREIGRIMGHSSSAWLHQVFGAGLDQERIDFDTFVLWSADLVDSGHNYLGVSAIVLVRALQLDARNGSAPGYLFRTLTKVIGGRGAEPRSHVLAVLECLRTLWSDLPILEYRQPATGLLLERLISEREDYGPMLRAVRRHSKDFPRFGEYLGGWVRGHFLPADVVASD